MKIEEKKYIYLSHFLNEDTPSYGNRNPFKREFDSQISCCKTANSQIWHLSNHIGTHIDFPYHFDEVGKKLQDYPPNFFIFKDIQLLNLECEAGYIILLNDLCEKLSKTTDFLIIKTGFESYRGKSVYWENNPGIHPEVGLELRKSFPKLKAIGFDFISLTSFKNRELGKEAHKSFLHSKFDNPPIVLVEDMKLSELTEAPKSLIALPLLVDNCDGAPVTIVAEL